MFTVLSDRIAAEQTNAIDTWFKSLIRKNLNLNTYDLENAAHQKQLRTQLYEMGVVLEIHQNINQPLERTYKLYRGTELLGELKTEIKLTIEA